MFRLTLMVGAVAVWGKAEAKPKTSSLRLLIDKASGQVRTGLGFTHLRATTEQTRLRHAFHGALVANETSARPK